MAKISTSDKWEIAARQMTVVCQLQTTDLFPNLTYSLDRNLWIVKDLARYIEKNDGISKPCY